MHELWTTLTWLALISYTLAGLVSTIKSQPRLFIDDRLHGMWLLVSGLALMFGYIGINGLREHPQATTTLWVLIGQLAFMCGIWWVSKPNGWLRRQPTDAKWYIGASGFFIIFALGLAIGIAIQDKENAAYLAHIQKNDPAAYKTYLAEQQAQRMAEIQNEQRLQQQRQHAEVVVKHVPTEDEETMSCMEGVKLNDSFAYYDVSKKILLKQLRAPSTAKFPNIREVGFTRKLAKDHMCLTTVHGYVDAQNGFGAQIRQHWEVIFKSHADNTGLELEEVKIGKW